MKPTDFSKYLTDFLTRYLPHERGASPNTICSYRDTFITYLNYMEANGIKAEKLTMNCITKASIVSFLDWLETERGCSISTRNLRLAAIHSFFKYVQYQHPDNIYEGCVFYIMLVTKL
jgi:site-specific recombinase XerD